MQNLHVVSSEVRKSLNKGFCRDNVSEIEFSACFRHCCIKPTQIGCLTLNYSVVCSACSPVCDASCQSCVWCLMPCGPLSYMPKSGKDTHMPGLASTWMLTPQRFKLFHLLIRIIWFVCSLWHIGIYICIFSLIITINWMHIIKNIHIAMPHMN